MKTCSILVLNFNGRRLLAKNLASVIQAARSAGCHVVVVDNGSTDRSIDYVKKQFPTIKTIALGHNLGFGQGNNQAVKRCASDLIILLNNDVVPQVNAFQKLVPHFANQNIFAVSCSQIVKTDRAEFVGGVAIGEFSRGLLRHYPSRQIPQSPIPQLYASGGAAAFDRQKFLELGGFDSLYAPFYWEDADLSTRAWARGWQVLYEPRSVVEHRHESTIKRVYPLWYVKAIGDRNLFIFNWRHLNGIRQWLLHFVWLPVHIARRPLSFLMAIVKIPHIFVRRSRSKTRPPRSLFSGAEYFDIQVGG